VAAAAFALMMFALFRRLGLPLPVATLLFAVCSVSAFFLFWFTLPETYPWGCLTIIAPLLLVAGDEKQTRPAWSYGVASAVSLAVTTTNWMVGLAATLARYKTKWKQLVLVSAAAFAAILALSVVQKKLFNNAWLFIKPWGETRYVGQQQSGGPVRALTVATFHTMVMPAVSPAPHSREAGKTVLRVQFSAPGSASLWGKVAAGCWVLLLAAGVFALFAVREHRMFRLTLGLSLLGQLGLHSVYGAETFLYAAHFGPLFIAAIALAMLTKLRPVLLGLTTLLLVALVLNNLPQFNETMALIVKNAAH